MNSDCIFCKIISGDIPSYKVYEDENVIAFLDIFPIRPGHMLVVPKVHVDEFQNLDDTIYQEVMMQVRNLARKIKDVYKPAKVGIMVMGWDVPHAHIHVLPMEESGDITSRIYIEGAKTRASYEDLEKTIELFHT